MRLQFGLVEMGLASLKQNVHLERFQTQELPEHKRMGEMSGNRDTWMSHGDLLYLCPHPSPVAWLEVAGSTLSSCRTSPFSCGPGKSIPGTSSSSKDSTQKRVLAGWWVPCPGAPCCSLVATGSRVPFSGLKEEEEEDVEADEEEEEEDEGFFQKVLTLPFSWLLSRRLWLGPQCSKLPLLSCCRQLPPAGPPGDGDGWLKSFQRSRRICFTSKSFRPEPDMLDARKAKRPQLAQKQTGQRVGRPIEPGLEEEEAGALCTPGSDGARRLRALPGDNLRAERRAAGLSCGQVHRTCAWGAQSRGAEAGAGRRGLRISDPGPGIRWLPRRGTTLKLEMRKGERSAHPKARILGGGGSWIHLPGMHPSQNLSREAIGSPILAAQSSVPGERRERERSPSREEAHSRSLSGAPAPLSLASPGCPEKSLRVSLRKSDAFCKEKRGSFVQSVYKRGKNKYSRNIGKQKEKPARVKLSRSSQYNFLFASAPPPRK